jgi:DNA-binding GntR family transcriptional regulator
MSEDQTTLAEQAFKQIYDLIMTGELPLGAVVNEVVLSQRFDISRGPVREAISRLQGLKLVTREPYLRARVVSLSASDLREIFQLREAAEGMAARLCTETITPQALGEMERSFEEALSTLQSDENKPPAFDLHIAVASHCGNLRIQSLLREELYDLLRIYRLKSGDTPGRRTEASDEHWCILRAISARDADRAERLMRSHIRHATRVLLQTNAVD